MNQAEKAFQTWGNTHQVSSAILREIAEAAGGIEIYSDDVYYVIQMPDKSCVVDSSTSEYTFPNIEAFFKHIESFEDWEI